MPRVGLITGSYPRFDGDLAGSFVKEHVRYLRSNGWDVDVIAASDSDSAPGSGSGSGSETRIRGRGLFYGGGAPEALDAGGAAWWRAALFTTDLAREVRLRARHCDAIVAHWLIPGALVAMAVAPRRPLLAVAHSGDVHTLARLRALGAFGRLAARRNVRLSFVTRELRDLFLAAQPPERRLATQVCPMGIDVARFRRARAATATAATSTVLFLGRLVPVKGVAHLIDAARRWRSDTRLVIAGAGPDEARLRHLAADSPRITFAGEVSGFARDGLLAIADTVAVPSVRLDSGRSEGLPLVALEAMAARAALVASAVGGLAEIPAAAVSRVRPGDPDGLAAAIDALAADRVRRAAQLAAQDDFVAAHDWALIGPRLAPESHSPSA